MMHGHSILRCASLGLPVQAIQPPPIDSTVKPSTGGKRFESSMRPTTASCARRALATLAASSVTAALPPPALVTFDCTGTIFTPTKPIGQIYKAALVRAAAQPTNQQHRPAVAALDAEAIDGAFRAAYKRVASERPCFGAGVCTSRRWWLDVVTASYEGAGLGAGARDALLGLAFDSLFDDVFCTREGFELLPHVEAALRRLKALRDAQPDGERMRLGVISNWDDRLPTLLDNLRVRDCFDVVLTSHAVGAEKPSSILFDRIRHMTGVPPTARAVHIGDSFSRDVLGAAGAGFEAVLVRPGGTLSADEAAQTAQSPLPTVIQDMRELGEVLGLPSS